MAWLTGYTYRKKLTVDNTKIDSILSDFPVLVKLDSGNFDFTNARSDGFDVRFTSDDGETLLKYERERHDDSAELAEYHVKVPSISSSADQDFYMYFGKPNATDGEDAINTWDSNFLFVSHMTDVTTSTVKNSVDGSSFNKASANNPLESSGQVNKSQDFSSDYITLGDIGLSTTQGTVSILCQIDTFSDFRGLFTTNDDGANDAIRIEIGASGIYMFDDTMGIQSFDSTKVNGVYGLLTGVWNSTNMLGYSNEVNSFDVARDTTIVVNDAILGRGFNTTRYLDGLVGEIRLSDTDRSASWVKATKESLFDTLLTYGSEEGFLVQEFLDLTENITKSVSKALEEFLDLTENVSSNVSVSAVIQENLDLTETVVAVLSKSIIESLDLTENIDVSPSLVKQSISENLDLTEVVSAIVPQLANNASKIISYNPLIFVTNTNPAKIVEIDTTDPENPIHTTFTLTGAKNAKDVARNSVTGFLYVACANGIVVKVDETDLNVQTIIDLSDTDDLQTMEVLDTFNIAYTSTDSSTGELYMIDERTTVLGDFRLDVLSTQTVFGDFQFDTIEVSQMDSDFTVLSTITTGFGQFIFNCLDSVIDLGSPVTPLDQIIPIKRTDFVVFIDSVQLEQFDVDLASINITHNIDEESIATFNLNRRHDQMDVDLESNSRIITNQNAIKITIQGRTEFDGFVSNLNCQYNETEELITVTATATEKISSFNNVALSLPSNTTRLGLYDILVQNPQIYNPVIDPDDENPKRFKGVKVDLGQKREQSFSGSTIFDSGGRIAEDIQDGTFVPKQNWTYFWGPTVKQFGDVELGNTSAITFFYIGTSLSPVSEDLWVLTNARHHRQRQYDDIITELGEYTVGVAPFKNISTRNGVFIPKDHWSDENNGLYSLREAGFNFIDYAKEIADLEYQLLFNINDQILPETSCDISLTIDNYYYNNITLLNRINIDNTIQVNIYKNNNGFPTSVKSININSGSMKVTLSTDNLKSNQELEIINGQFPDENDTRFNEEEKRILIDLKDDMKSRLQVQ